MIVTVDDVRRGVIRALDARFPDSQIYGEPIKQGFAEASFFVKLLQGAQERLLGRRYSRAHSFDVHYFARSNADAHQIAEQLYAHLEYIEVSGGLCRGRGMTHEVVDGVLHFFVSYDLHVFQPAPKEAAMGDLKQKGELK